MARSPRSRWLMLTTTFVLVDALPLQFFTVRWLLTVARSAITTSAMFVTIPHVAAMGVAAAARFVTFSSLFGEPVPALVTLPVRALATRASRTRAGVAVGLADRYRAAAPVTCGVAIEVPLIVVVAVSALL